MAKKSKRSGLASALFTGTQERVLGLLFGYSERSFYASEVISRARAGSGGVQRELARLEAAGLITARRIGSQKHYQANARAPLFEELRSIVRKTVGLVEPLREALAPFAAKIVSAFVYGSVAGRTDTAQSDVDLMIISDDVTYADIFRVLETTSVSLGRKINPTVYSRKELEKRIKDRNSFVTRVLRLPKLWLIGPEVWRVLSKCHDLRNRTEYEGAVEVDERLVSDLISACRAVAKAINALPPLPAA